MKAQTITRCGMLIALLSVSAWVTLPLGPIPLTLQTLALSALVIVASPGEAMLSVGLYLVLGAAGLPLFSHFGAGIAQIAGPTGGYLWGFFVGTAAAQLIRGSHTQTTSASRDYFAAGTMLVITYLLGTAQLMFMMQISLTEALGIAVLPFAIPDTIKLVIGVRVGQAVRRALTALKSA